MKKIYLTGAFALLALSASAQSKFDAATQTLVESAVARQSLPQTARILSIKAPAADNSMAFIIEKTPDCTAADLENAGARVNTIADRFAVVETTVDGLEALAALEGVVSISANHINTSYNNIARTVTKVEAVHKGEGLSQPYTGKGVITAVVDLGIEPVHANFITSDGELRVKHMWHFSSNNGTFSEYSGDELLMFTSDNGNETHGTHVAGTMAGSYNEISRYAVVNDNNTIEIKKSAPLPFYGMAPEADILLSGGALYDANIIGGATKALEYARENGQPMVLNLSLGHNHGPHDGTDVATAALDEVGKEAIVCVAAGNEGDTPLAITKLLTDDDPMVQTVLRDDTGYGIVDIWGSDDKPFTTSWSVFDSQTFEYVADMTADNEAQNTTLTWGSSGSQIKVDAFNNNFTGYVSLMTRLDPRNNRWNVYSVVNVNRKQGAGSRYWLVLKIEGQAGQTIFVYGNDKTTFTNKGFDTLDNGGYNGTINGMGCGKNMITVGSFTSRLDCPNLSNSVQRFSGIPGDLSYFSSWGELADGRKLPTVCGPGEWLASSLNTSYVKNGLQESRLTAAEAVNLIGTTNYWGYLQGTSMASPAVAGIIALWLEANPHLTYNQVVDIINRTSIRDKYVTESKKPSAWGAGKIDALAGLKEALNMASVTTPVADGDKALIATLNGSSLELFVAGVDAISATLTNMQGATVASTRADGDTATIETEGLADGIYIATVDTSLGRISRKIAIR